MTTRLRLLSAAVAALTALAASVTPAAAGPPGTIAHYTWLRCPAGTSTTAAIERLGFGLSDTGAPMISASGWISTCRLPAQHEVFAYAAYTTDGKANGKPIGFSGLGYPYAAGVDVERLLQSNFQAVCLIADEVTRLACAAVTWHTVDGALRPQDGGPIPVDSPLVSARASTNLLVTIIDGLDPPHCDVCP